MLKGIIFDLDGTLVESLTVTFEAFNHGITTQGGRTHTREQLERYFGPGEDRIFAQILGEDKAQAAYQASREFMDRNLNRVGLHAGIGELIEGLKALGVAIGIFTGRSWKTTELILKHHRILDSFVTVIANDHVKNPKPAPDGVRLAASNMGIRPEEALYIGDSELDLMSAHRAGARSGGAAWDPLTHRQKLLAQKPNHLFDHPTQILEILK